MNKTVVLTMIALFGVVIFTRETKQEDNSPQIVPAANVSKSKQKTTSISQSTISECINKVAKNTYYSIDRLSFIGTDEDNALVVLYKRKTSDGTHKFRCVGSKVEMWAKGGAVWISM
ncbi:hypothetical protein L1286_00455 [Pseudoalteromonas sp. SMS1]|uniref:hypothetical protein n=1 Tax=Pseudoalteromonas sp. SMS1 TaxID=2908894 RepID=UPI001F301060|nr:hypothetical protein [Pseudoalteromonas sp. SMS1]MCF2855926.1 hypothetical protein [Pseudoalteromonas sp. SMS1]